MASPSRSRPRSFLPRDPRVEPPYRLRPQIAFRIGILAAVTLAAFAVLFLRLWALQILSGPQYLRAAQNNQLRTIRVEAPRGPILDRRGRRIVENRSGAAVQVWPADLPKKHRFRELKRLARLLDVPAAEIAAKVDRHAKADPLSPVTIKESAAEDEIAYLYERRVEFPGVYVVDSPLRKYPYGQLAAHVIGHVGEINPDQLKARRGYRLGDKIGQLGIEAIYDRYLRGESGVVQLRVDSLGRPQGGLTPESSPTSGHAVRLTLDVDLQRAAEEALVHGIGLAKQQENYHANGGAIVALDPRNGAVLAMASAPTYKPQVYVGRPKRRQLAALVEERAAEAANFPALNRAVGGLYPPGSTFKPVTALAAMQEQLMSPYAARSCTGDYKVYREDGTLAQRFRNWDPYVFEAMTLPTALAASCDTYFYDLGYGFYKLPPERGHPLQDWAASFGFGKETGVDIGSESSGLLPTPEWRKATFTKERYPDTWQIDRLWKPGDSIQLAIGQKDLLVTPLQMARFYALIANGGKLVTPHVLMQVERPGDRRSPAVVLQRSTAPPPVDLALDPFRLGAVRQGLVEATTSSRGTSTPIFGNFPIPVAGKTGTAEKAVDIGDYAPLIDQSWWCGYGPSDREAEIVVCAVIENGGFGAEAAAPAALRVFERYFRTDETPIQLPDVSD